MLGSHRLSLHHPNPFPRCTIRRSLKLVLLAGGALAAMLTASDATAKAMEYPTTCQWNNCSNYASITCIDTEYVWCPKPMF